MEENVLIDTIINIFQKKTGDSPDWIWRIEEGFKTPDSIRRFKGDNPTIGLICGEERNEIKISMSKNGEMDEEEKSKR